MNFIELIAKALKKRAGIKAQAAMNMMSRVRTRLFSTGRIIPKVYWKLTYRDADGKVLRVSEYYNLVVNVGLDDILDKYFKGSAYTAAWYVGITDGTPTFAAADTMASHAGWVEVTAYSEAVRQTLTLGTVASQSVDNSASKATFSINADSTTIGGAFIATDNTKGGSTGILFGGAADPGGDQVLNNGGSLEVQITLTAASA